MNRSSVQAKSLGACSSVLCCVSSNTGVRKGEAGSTGGATWPFCRGQIMLFVAWNVFVNTAKRSRRAFLMQGYGSSLRFVQGVVARF